MKQVIVLIFVLTLFPDFLKSQQPEYFSYAIAQLKKYNPSNKEKVIIIDYRKNIFQERLFVLDMKRNIVLINSKVSHAWNSGKLYANKFSNQPNSKKSSKGNYITLGTKFGKFGYSILVKGLDEGINSNAKNRNIIFHSDKLMKTKWSDGCLATPEKINKKIIELTKRGVLVCIIV